jgi:hypothetical protein
MGKFESEWIDNVWVITEEVPKEPQRAFDLPLGMLMKKDIVHRGWTRKEIDQFLGRSSIIFYQNSSTKHPLYFEKQVFAIEKEVFSTRKERARKDLTDRRQRDLIMQRREKQ